MKYISQFWNTPIALAGLPFNLIIVIENSIALNRNFWRCSFPLSA